MKKTLLSAVAAAAILASTGAMAAPASAPSGASAMIGALVCEKTGTGTTYIIHSKIPVDCVYHGVNGDQDYVGTTGILLGADLEIEPKMIFAYTVLGGADISKGGLSGHYVGAKASATAGVGVSAQGGLVGGGPHAFTLVPFGLGVQTGFGAAAGIGYLEIAEKVVPPAPVVAPVVVAPPPPVRDRAAAFFEFDHSDLTPEAKIVVDQAAALLASHHSAKVVVVGHGDTVGTYVYNYDLGMRRAATVKAELAARGVNPAIIEIDSHGKTDLAVPTADQVREAGNRRAEITGNP